MKLPVHSILWPSLLLLLVSQSATESVGNNLDDCDEEIEQNFTGHESSLENADVKETFICLLHPTSILNCSWSFHTLQKDAQLSVYISVCDDDGTAVQYLNHTSVGRVGSMSLIVSEHEVSNVILLFNMSLHDKWQTCTYEYDKDKLELLSPPPKISVSVKDGNLHVTWDLPHSQANSNSSCFAYELDLGDQETPITFEGKQSYTDPDVDPTHTYRVRMRTRISSYCFGSSHWSDWSHTVKLEQSIYKLNLPVIISISLGIPMILLAVLLLVRHQRVSKVLFPPIPRPPLKYKYFLEKNDAFTSFHPARSAKPEEEITEVEDAEQNPGKTF